MNKAVLGKTIKIAFAAVAAILFCRTFKFGICGNCRDYSNSQHSEY